MKKVVFVHGFNGNSKGGTFKKLKTFFPDCEIFSEQLNLMDFNDTIKKITASKPDILVGNSLGGFYVLSYQAPCAKIVINPCMKPELEIPKLDGSIPSEITARWHYEIEHAKANVTEEIKEMTFGIFGIDDELFHYKPLFDKEFAVKSGEEHSILVPGGHHLSDYPGIDEGLKAAVEYFKGKQVL